MALLLFGFETFLRLSYFGQPWFQGPPILKKITRGFLNRRALMFLNRWMGLCLLFQFFCFAIAASFLFMTLNLCDTEQQTTLHDRAATSNIFGHVLLHTYQ